MTPEDDSKKLHPPYSQRDRMDLVLHYFVQGMSIPVIVQQLKEEHGIEVGRDVPYQDISRATNQRWLKYEAPKEVRLSDALKTKYDGILDAYVPRRGERMAVMEAGARLCAQAIGDIAQAKAEGKALGKKGKVKPNGRKDGEDKKEEVLKPWPFPVRFKGAGGEETERDLAELEMDPDGLEEIEPLPLEVEVRIGFSGGQTMSQTARYLGQALAERVEEWEKDLKTKVFSAMKEAGYGNLLPTGLVKRRFKVAIKFIVVNMVSGFDLDPHTNPIAFLNAYFDDPVLRPRTRLKIFNAMPFVEIGRGKDLIAEVGALREVREDYEENGFDVILTSGSSISDKHSTFRRYYSEERLTNLLVERGVQGDYFWQPLTNKSPFSLKALREDLGEEWQEILKYRPMTLLDLHDLADHVRKKRDVFFILAPCSQCLKEKTQIGKAVLAQTRSIATHLVVDRQTAEGILDED